MSIGGPAALVHGVPLGLYLEQDSETALDERNGRFVITRKKIRLDAKFRFFYKSPYKS